MTDIMGLVTMCRRAGKLKMGMDMTKNACAAGEASGVLVASDISEKSLKEVKYFCQKHNVVIYSMGMDMDEVSIELGKKTGILAVCDMGFMKALSAKLTIIENDTQI